MTTPLDTIHDDCSISSLHKYCSDCDLCRDRNIEANAIERTKAGIAEELLGYESATGIDSWLKVHQAAQIALNYEESPITNRQVESLQIVKCNSNVNVNVNVSNPDVTNIDVTGWGNGNEVPDVAPEGTATPISLPQIGTTAPILSDLTRSQMRRRVIMDEADQFRSMSFQVKELLVDFWHRQPEWGDAALESYYAEKIVKLVLGA
jgi:hypothetical protein